MKKKASASRKPPAARALESGIAEARDRVKQAKKKSKLAKAELKEARAKLKAAKRARKEAAAKARAALASRRRKTATKRAATSGAAARPSKPARTRAPARRKAVRAPVPENGPANALDDASVEVTLPVEGIEPDADAPDQPDQQTA